MKLRIKRILSSLMTVSMALGMLQLPINAEGTRVNVLSYENASFTLNSSAGEVDGERALDGNIITSTGIVGYDGIPIFDINGNQGNDYIILMTLALENQSPMERLKLNWENGKPYANGSEMYLGKPTRPWAEGFEIYASSSGATGSWEKVYQCDSMEGKLLTEKRPETIWDDTDGMRTYYDITFDKKVNAKYLRIAIREMKPWLGDIMLCEVELYGAEENIPSEYHKLTVEANEDVTYSIAGKDRIGEDYIRSGSNVQLTVNADEFSQINKVSLSGSEIEKADGVYSFTMPDSPVVITVDSGINDDENVPLELISSEVAGGYEVKTGTIPVMTFTFNRKVGEINRDMIWVNGEKTSLIQHAFTDATDAKKVYVVPYADKLSENTVYTIAIDSSLKSAADMSMTGTAQVSFKTEPGYKPHKIMSAGFISGYGDGTFRPENGITLKEAHIIANRIRGDVDYSSVPSSDKKATRLELAQMIYIVKNGSPAGTADDMFISLVTEGIFKGYADGSYRKENNVTRAEAVALFNRATGRTAQVTNQKAKFDDVSEKHWAFADIQIASSEESTDLYWTKNIKEVELDVYNSADDIWTQVPCISQELRDMGISGGEGGQWMQSIEVDNTDGQLLFAGVDIGGMIRSTDGGETWERSYRGYMAAGCIDIAIDPNNNDRVLAIGSVSDSPYTGIYMSENRGDSWNHVHSYPFKGQRDTRKQLAWDKSSYDEEIGGSRVAYWSNLYRIAENLDGLTDSSRIMRTHHQGGLFKTEDGGKTWFCVNDEMSDSVVAVHPEKGTVYVGNERGFFISHDGGKTFENIFEGEPIYGLDVIETRPDNVYVNDSKGILISEDGGKTFTRIIGEGFPNKTDLSDVRNITKDLAVSPANPDYMLVDCRDYINYKNRRYFTHDGGKTWAECGYDGSLDFFFNHNRQHPFAWHPTDENKVWSLGGDWVTSSSNGGETFIWDANGYCGVPPGGRLNFNPYNTDLIYGGAQDLLGILSVDNGYTWKAIEAASGFGCSYGTYTPDGVLLIAANADGWYDPRYIHISRDGGETWENTGKMLKNGLARRATSFWGSTTDLNTFFAGEYVTRDRAETWEEMKGCQMVMAMNYYHNKEIWGLNKEVIVCSYDNGKTWLPFSEVYIDNEEVLLNFGSMYTSGTGKHVWDVEYDGINDIIYYIVGSVNSGKTLVRIENNVHKNLGANIIRQHMQQDKWYQVLAIDPRHPEILYLGGYGAGMAKATAAVQRSCDGGETFQVLSSMGDVNSIVKNGPSAGSGPETLVVQPDTGELWMWDRAEGFWKFPPPYSE